MFMNMASGFEKEKIRKFDESQKDVSDIIIVVRSSKFYVLRMYLASQSAFFKSLLIENRSVFNKREIALPGIDPDDFHSFLEVLYGESAIDDSNVEEVLFLADKFDSLIVKRRCEEFLMEKSEKTLVKKQKLANCYHLQNENFTCAIANTNSKTKQFILKHSFRNVTSFKEGVDYCSDYEDHFNVNWCIMVKLLNNHLACYVICKPIASSVKWSIQTKIELKVVGRNQNDVIRTFDYCFEKDEGRGYQFLEWEKMEKDYLINGYLTVEAKVTIMKTTGLGKEKLRMFDESQKDVSDVILVVRRTNFYVSKMFLASQSSYFKTIFTGNSTFFNNPAITLPGIDPDDFHCFLEVLYGEESAIDDSNVEGVLFLADMLDSPAAKRRCEVFLLKESKKTFKTKSQIARRYHLDNWNLTCAIANANSKIKQFILEHSFQDVTSFEEGEDYYSESEDNFNVRWYIYVKRSSDHLGFFVYCEPIAPSDKWSIRTKLELKVVGRNQNDVIKTSDCCYGEFFEWGFPDFQEWEKMEKGYLIDGNLTVEATVTIIETTGLGKEKIREFSESQKDDSNVILAVRNTKFYASKSYLADLSLFFKVLLFGNSLKSEESEVRLDGVDPNDFHYFLEVLYGETAIDDSTIEGILMLADKYDTPMVVKKCQEFLSTTSKTNLKKKLELAFKYNLEELKTQCMSEIKTVADIREVRNVHGMDPLITAALLEKSLSLQ